MLAYTCNSRIRQADVDGYGVSVQPGCPKKRQREIERERRESRH
jgi:hypothetical protein